MPVIQDEIKREILGVPGRAFNVATWAGNGSSKNPDAIANQKWVSESRRVNAKEWGPGRVIRAEIRFDDNCKNGKQSFAITGEIFRPGARDWDAGGCLHDEIARYFPELKPLIQWHSQDQKAPMHYVANAVYHASNRDHWGKVKGEPTRYEYAVRFGGVPMSHPVKKTFWDWLQTPESGGPAYDLEVIDISESKPSSMTGKPHIYHGFTFGGYPDADSWHKAPFKTERAAFEFLESLQGHVAQFDRIPVEWSEGKERDFDAARRAANWPDATDAELSLPKAELIALLEARLPDLQEAFRAAMAQDCGFIWQELPEAVA